MASACRMICWLLLVGVYGIKGDVFHDSWQEGRLRQDLFGNRTKLDKHMRPSAHANQSTDVEIGLALIGLLELDPKREILESVFWLRLVWNDYRMQWNGTDYGGIGVIRAKSELIWTPNFILENSAEPLQTSSGASKFSVLIYQDGTVLWVPSRREEISCAVNLRDFPFDEQECHWSFVPWGNNIQGVAARLYAGKKLIDMSDYWEADEWIVTHTSARIEREVKPIFTAHFKRRSHYYFFSVIMPLVVAWGMVLTLFWLPPAAQEKVTMASFSSLFIFIQVINLYHIVPHGGKDVPRIVVFTGTTLAFAIISLLLSLASVRLCRDAKWTVPQWVSWLCDGPCGTMLCLGPSTRGVSIGARLLSSNDELTVTPDHQLWFGSETKEQGESDWTLAATALNRICFIAFCIVFFTLLLSCLLG